MILFCEICGRPAIAQCRLCGRNVCERHLVENGICVYCSETLCEICGERLAITTCPICGRRVCEKCSIQITPIVRVCRECYSKYELKMNEWPPNILVDREKHNIERLKSLTLRVLRLI